MIWLSNDGESVLRDANERVFPFRHEVEVDENDPDLVVDEKFEKMMQMSEQAFNKPMPLRWYSYSKPLEVLAVAEFDEEKDIYIAATP